MNLWADIGLCDGATGTIVDFIYVSNQQPPDLPIAIILKFNDYTGPSLTNRIPGCVPICPICNTLDGLQERQQLPLKIAWVITIHKNRGLTLVNLKKLLEFHMLLSAVQSKCFQTEFLNQSLLKD